MRSKSLAPWLVGVGLVLGGGAMPGCNCGQNDAANFHRDLSGIHDLSMSLNGDGPMMMSNPDSGNACGDEDPSCTVISTGPSGNPSMPFPLPTDDPPPSNVNADGVGRDPTGALILDSSHANFDFLWVADDVNWGLGLISKISTKPRTVPAGVTNPINTTYNEVARYITVTCYSDNTKANWPDRSMITTPDATAPACDGTAGCCDNSPVGSRKPINLHDNRPSRTAVDFNGDVWVSNRAFGLQSSVSKIANKNDSNPTMSDCIDRNGNGKIDTSSDVNGDGIIDTDCNQNMILDDLLDVAKTPCVAGKQQEFFGLDDECVLFTTDTGNPDGWGRPLALGPGSNGDFGPSDAWAGRYQDGTFYRLNGKTGLIMTTVVLPNLPNPNDVGKVCASASDCSDNANSGAGGPNTPSVQCLAGKCMIGSHPYGATIDQFGILWAPDVDGHFLFYFDTTDPNNTARQGMVAPPPAVATPGADGIGFYGVTLDGYQDAGNHLVQQVWMASYGMGGAFRYRPVRTSNFSDLATGTWAFVTFTGASYAAANGRGIAADNRSPANVWVGIDSSPGGVGRIDDAVADGPSTSANVYRTGAYEGDTTLGVGVANDLDIWGVNQGDNSLTHYTVAPSPAAADLTPQFRIELSDNKIMGHPALADGMLPHPYTYSDFTGFGLRNFTNPRGFYQWTQPGCGDGAAGKTKWLKVVWDANLPPNTAIALKVRSADDPASLQLVPFSAPYTISPADLQAMPALMPNPSGYIQVEFDLTTMQKDVTPTLKGFQIIYECENGIS